MSDTTKPGLSRRTLAKGAAWAVPAVAAAAPAMALSGGGPNIIMGLACKQPGASCKHVGTKGYTFAVTIENKTGLDLYIYTGLTQTAGTLYTPEFTLTYISDAGKTFTYGDARLVTFATDGTPIIGEKISDPNESLLIPNGGSVTILVDAGTNTNSAQLAIRGSLYFAWGHTPLAGGDQDHSYTPKTLAEGWKGGTFNYPAFDSCQAEQFYDCVPFLQ